MRWNFFYPPEINAQIEKLMLAEGAGWRIYRPPNFG